MRWLKSFGINLASQLNKTNGVAAIAGFLFGFISLATTGWVRMLLWIFGGVILLAAIVPAVIRANPGKIKAPKDYLGQDINLAQFRGITPPVPAVGIVGVEEVGKTVLKNYLVRHPQQHGTTQRISARITNTIPLHKSDEYIAIVDGPGDTMVQQFEIAGESDILLVLLDNNIVPGQSGIAAGRLEQHRDFGAELRKYLQHKWEGKTPKFGLLVHILMNKKDDWEKASSADQAVLRALLHDETTKWTSLRFVDSVTAVEHASTRSDDISAVDEVIKSLWAQRRPVVN